MNLSSMEMFPMTARPEQDLPGQEPVGVVEATFTEMEDQLKRATEGQRKLNLDETKLDADDIPDDLKGKSVRELINQRKEMENLLKMSEQARQQALATANVAGQRHAEREPAKPDPVVEAMVTTEEVAAAFQEDTTKGVQLLAKMQDQSIQKAAAHFAQRIDPLVTGSVSQAELAARTSHKDEFELYGDDIKAVVDGLPNKNAMSTTQSWDDVVAYVVGKNPKKLFDHYRTKEQATAAAAAQDEQRRVAGFSGQPAQRTPAPAGAPTLDATTLEICRVLGMEPSDYITWSKVR